MASFSLNLSLEANLLSDLQREATNAGMSVQDLIRLILRDRPVVVRLDEKEAV